MTSAPVCRICGQPFGPADAECAHCRANGMSVPNPALMQHAPVFMPPLNAPVAPTARYAELCARLSLIFGVLCLFTGVLTRFMSFGVFSFSSRVSSSGVAFFGVMSGLFSLPPVLAIGLGSYALYHRTRSRTTAAWGVGLALFMMAVPLLLASLYYAFMVMSSRPSPGPIGE